MKKKKNNSDNLSIIDTDLTVEGAISSKGKLIIKGSVKGDIQGDTIVIAEEGSAYTNMTASSVTIGGVFEGDVTATTELIVLSTGRCSGKVVCKDLVVENGGILNADVTCQTAGEIKTENKSLLKQISVG